LTNTKKRYSKKYLSEHEADISVYRAAQAKMREILQGERLPKMETLRTEWQSLATAKKSGYQDYRAAQKNMREIITVKANVDHLLSILEREQSKEKVR
jgi:Spy/CpxP family protein refolding chaperone